jgi:tRNA(Arg) A34 adenosine deaminase TadA
MLRETTITVSYDEKDRLDEARREMFGTDEVPYGAVITRLVDEVTKA